MLTASQWQKIENRLFDFQEAVIIKADGYTLTLVTFRKKSKLIIQIFVNGKCKADWSLKDCEIRHKFFCPKTSCLLSQKQIESYTQNRKFQKELRKQYSYTYYVPYWSAFSRLKSHLIKSCMDMEYTE